MLVCGQGLCLGSVYKCSSVSFERKLNLMIKREFVECGQFG